MGEADLDNLALKYSEKKEPNTIYELIDRLQPLLKYRAWQSSERYYFLDATKDDYLSYYMEAAWKAAKNYNGSSRFMQRLNTFIREAEIAVYRHHSRKKRQTWGRVTSLESLVIEDDLDETRVQFRDPLSPIDEYIEKDMLDNFRQKAAEQTKNIITYLWFGCTNKEIAQVLGSSEYKEKERKKVQRAREEFRRYYFAA